MRSTAETCVSTVFTDMCKRPNGVHMELDGSVGAGAIDFFDDHRAGYEVELQGSDGDPTGYKTLIIHARSSMGSLDIDRVESGLEGESL